MRAAGLLFALRCTHSPFRGAAPVLARSTFVDPGAPGFGREGPWVRAPSQEGALSAVTRSRILTCFRRDDWSGRQDLNLRPPGPERALEESHGVSSAGTAEQPPEKTGEQEAPNLDTVAPHPLVETPFGAPVVRELPSGSGAA